MSRVVAEGALESAPAGDASGAGEIARSPEQLEKRKELFSSLCVPLTEMLYGAAARMLGNRVQAEDLVQETFVRAWKNFDRFEIGTNFKAWVFQILTYLYLNERRSAKSRDSTVDFSENDILEAPESKPQVEPTQVLSLDWNKLYPDLVEDEFSRALKELKEEQRSVLMLVTVGDLTYQECADALNVPIGTVMSRLFRARKQLQKELYDFAKERGYVEEA